MTTWQMANTITVITSFWLGRYIVEQEQQGQECAKYGSKIIQSEIGQLDMIKVTQPGFS